METEPKVVVIGAGIAGLAAGCYARMNGFDVTVLEMHDKPGGLCTSWQRKGYTIDACLHWLVGSKPGTQMYPIWEELGVVQGRKFIDHEVFGRCEDARGSSFTLYCDVDRVEQELLRVAPEDRKRSLALIRGIRSFIGAARAQDRALHSGGLLRGLRFLFTVLPRYVAVFPWLRSTVKDVGESFTNPLVRAVFSRFWPGEFPAAALLITLAWASEKNAGYAIGGSLPIARAIEKRFVGLGGRIEYQKKVAKVLVENDAAVGVRLEDGTELRADYVVSAADGHATIFNMLDGRYVDRRIREMYDTWPRFPALVYVGLGVRRRFDELPGMVGSLRFRLRQPITVGNSKQEWLGIRVYNYDPTLAPEGRTVCVVIFEADSDWWHDLYSRPEEYGAAKARVAEAVVSGLEQRFPGIRDQVEMTDVATPVTWERYTGNWRASFEGWLMTRRNAMRRVAKTLPGLKNFWMCGQWVEPGGGLPPAATSARGVVQQLCKAAGRQFRALRPTA
jgi:phytoene dehydrogenase-like protein